MLSVEFLFDFFFFLRESYQRGSFYIDLYIIHFQIDISVCGKGKGR